jgi:hypothetical protein
VFRRLLVPLLAAVVLLALPAAAPAKSNVLVGIGDQNASMFSSTFYQQLKLKRTRYFIDWNAINNPAELARADEFVNAASASKIKVLLHISTDDLRPRKATLPSVAKYKAAVGALVARYRGMGVTDWGVWNEANHKTQPTYRSPKRAAEFYKAFRKFSCSGCKIVALDVLDQAGVERYIKRWLSAAGSAGRQAKVIGIHNYSEVNRKKTKGTSKFPGTKRIIDAVRKKNKRARYWYTETGALVKFGSFKCSTSRPKSTLRFMFALAKKFDRYVERLYSYNWTGADCKVRFDAGLVFANGQPRSHYSVFKSKLKDFRR